MGPFVFLLASALTGQAQDVPDTAEEVEREIRRLSESLATVRFVVEEFSLDDDGAPVEPPFQRFEYSSASPNRRRVKATSPFEGREVLSLWYYEDGKGRHSVETARDDLAHIVSVHAKDQVDTDDHYSELMNGAMALFMPRGRTLRAHLDDGAVLRLDESGDAPAWMVEVPVGEHTLRIELDPEHDWLPRKASLAGFQEDVCTRFERSNGRWFPAEGRSWASHGGEEERRGFRLASLSLNHPVGASEFAPKLADDVLLTHVEGNMIVGEYVGGPEARRAVDERAALVRPEVSPALNAVTSESGWSTTALMLVGIGLVAAGLAVGFLRRRAVAGDARR